MRLGLRAGSPGLGRSRHPEGSAGLAPVFASQRPALPQGPELQVEVFLGRSVVFGARRLAHGLFSFLGAARRVKSKDDSPRRRAKVIISVRVFEAEEVFEV